MEGKKYFSLKVNPKEGGGSASPGRSFVDDIALDDIPF
jgi:hypothetical protein